MNLDSLRDTSLGLKTALVIVLIGLLYCFCITFVPLPATGIKYVDTILGFFLGTLIAIPVGYYWGSSSKGKE
jgi:hypothetical protein